MALVAGAQGCGFDRGSTIGSRLRLHELQLQLQGVAQQHWHDLDGTECDAVVLRCADTLGALHEYRGLLNVADSVRFPTREPVGTHPNAVLLIEGKPGASGVTGARVHDVEGTVLVTTYVFFSGPVPDLELHTIARRQTDLTATQR